MCTQPGKNSPSLSAGAPLLCDRLAFLLGGAKDDMISKWEATIDYENKTLAQIV